MARGNHENYPTIMLRDIKQRGKD